MNNERYNQIIDEVYKNYANSHWTPPENPNSKLLAPQLWSVIPMQHNKESFIHEIKTNAEFSEKWGLKIEERELSLEERYEIRCKKENIRNDWEQFYSTFGGYKNEMDSLKKSLNGNNIPTKLITVTYKNEKTEIYE